MSTNKLDSAKLNESEIQSRTVFLLLSTSSKLRQTLRVHSANKLRREASHLEFLFREAIHENQTSLKRPKLCPHQTRIVNILLSRDV